MTDVALRTDAGQRVAPDLPEYEPNSTLDAVVAALGAMGATPPAPPAKSQGAHNRIHGDVQKSMAGSQALGTKHDRRLHILTLSVIAL